VRGGRDPRGSSVTATDRWPALADAFDGALPVVYRYVFSSTGGDAALTDDVTAATFLAAARGFAAGDRDRMALGPLHDAARAALSRRAGRSEARPAPRTGAGGDDGDALRRLPYRQRIVLALRFHDHLPVDDIAAELSTDAAGAERQVRAATTAFRSAAPPPVGDSAIGDADRDGEPGDSGRDERLCDLFASLDARPGEAYASGLRTRMQEEALAAPPALPPVPASPAVVPATPQPAVAVFSPPSPATDPGHGEAMSPDVPSLRRSVPDPEPLTSGSTGRNRLRRRRADAGSAEAAPVDILDPDGLPGPFAPAGLGSTGGRARVRTGPSPRASGLPAVIVTAAVLVALVLAGGGGGGGRDRAAAPPAPGASPGDGASRAGVGGSVEARLDDAVALAPAATVGGERPAPTAAAEVLERVRLGPGGPYMNGPFALDAGPEGLWAAAVGDDGTWRAVRVDPATGEVLAEIRIPGRIPSDRSHHGITVSGGYVWTPALRDGIFRIDAATNTPSGVVAVAGGVRGAAMDGGDGAVWAVGNDNVLRRIDARTTAVEASARVPEMGLVPTGVDLAYGGGTVWVTVADGEVRHLVGFDPVTLERRHHYSLNPLGLVADAYELAADRDRVVITETWPGGVTVVDGAGGRVVSQHRFATGGIAVDGDRAWVLSPLDGQATVVWTRTGDLMAAAGVPQGVETMVPTAEGGVWAAIPSTGEIVRLRFVG